MKNFSDFQHFETFLNNNDHANDINLKKLVEKYRVEAIQESRKQLRGFLIDDDIPEENIPNESRESIVSFYKSLF